MRGDYYARDAETFLRRSIGAHDKSWRRNRTGTRHINVHLRCTLSIREKKWDGARTMRRSIRRAAEIQLQRTNLLSHLSNSNAVRSFVRSAYRATENPSRMISRSRGEQHVVVVTLLLACSTKERGACPKTTESVLSMTDSLTNWSRARYQLSDYTR